MKSAFSESHPSHYYHQIPYALPFYQNNQPNTSFLVNQQGSGYDFQELEQAVALQGVKISNENDEMNQLTLYDTTNRPAATLEMFPSWPGSSKSGEESTDSGSGLNTRLLEPESESPINTKLLSSDHHRTVAALRNIHQPVMEARDGPDSGGFQTRATTKHNIEKRRGPGANSDGTLDAKTLRRLAQNREAARKSRLRKKAYVQQLETSRIRLTQLEQDLQRARSQGVYLGGGGLANGNVSSGGAMFDIEYARWLDDDHRHITELRAALQTHMSDGELRMIVDGYISHYDEIFRLKGVAAKSDVFHLITGMWTTPAERCFLWMGGFRPSDLIKMLMAQLDPLTEQQVVGIYGLQQSSQQAEEALSQGMEQLQQSLIEIIANGSINGSMHQMAIALSKLANLEGFVKQADNLRQQTLHQLRRILTVRQAARCFLVIGEYNGRLRALSSLWASRPRESFMADENSCQTMPDLQIVPQQSSQNPFANL